MAKRMYADVIMNGEPVNLVLRASSEKEARTKLNSREYKNVSLILDVSSLPPVREEVAEIIDVPYGQRKKQRGQKHFYTGGVLHTH